jgi:serine/threonine protein kinase/tetratricopeptide (TPR) repeat protein
MTQLAHAKRFEEVRLLGEGGMGVVYEARDTERGEAVALKKLRTFSPHALLRFKREFRAIQDLHHPNIVALRELFSEEGDWFFTMELVPGTDFFDYVRPRGTRGGVYEPTPRRHDSEAETADVATVATMPRVRAAKVVSAPPLDEERLRGALRQLASGLAALHEAGLVHRDVKPSNIRVTAEGRLVILDFGLVTDGTNHHTTAHNIVGTPAYMAPEQATRSDVGPEADWYSVGVLLYEALTGTLPFSGSTVEVLLQKQRTQPDAPSTRDPSVPPDLDRLCEGLLQQDAAARPKGDDILRVLGASSVRLRADPTTHRTQDSPFVGRDVELRELASAFDDARRKGAVSVLVTGESGVGKTCLVRQFVDAARARDPEVVVLMDRCYERESVPYKALDGVVDALARLLARMSDAEAATLLPTRVSPLVQAFPVLQRVAAIERQSRALHRALDPSELRARAFAAMRELLVRLTDRKPLIVVIDDAQWADSDSRLLLAEVLRPPDAPRLLLVATARSLGDDQSAAGRAGLLSSALPGDVRTIEVGRLGYEDGCRLAELLLERSRVADPAFARRIAEESGGHPFFIDTLVRSDALAPGQATPAAHLEDVLWETVERMDPLSRLLMHVLAVASAPVAQDVLASAASDGEGNPEVGKRLAFLRTAHLAQTTGSRARDTASVYHDRIRAAVLARLPEAERTRIHRRLALALERAPGQNAETIATHWLGAGEAANAVRQLVQAADLAAKGLAFEHAAALYQRALDLGVQEEADADATRVKLAEAFAKAGRGHEAARAYLEVAGDGTSNRALDLRRRAGEQLVCCGRVPEGLRTFEQTLAAAGLRAPRSNFAIIASLLLAKAWIALRGLRFVPRAEDEIDPRALLRVDCLASAGPGLGMSDHVRGSAFQMRSLIEALRVGEPGRVAKALAFYGYALASAGTTTFARVMELGERVAEMGRKLERPYLLAMAWGLRGFAYYLSGQYAAAREPLARAEVMLRDECVGVTYELSSGRVLLYRTRLALGELPGLAALADATLHEAERKGDTYTASGVRAGTMYFLALAKDDVAEARAILSRVRLPEGRYLIQHMHNLVARAQIALYAGDVAAARSDLEASWPALRRSMLLRIQSTRIVLHDLRARALLAPGSPVPARAIERDIVALERERAPWATAYADTLRASIAFQAGDRDEAIARLASAGTGFRTAGLRIAGAVAELRRGELLGGEAGAELVQASRTWMEEIGIRSPERICALYSPGFSPR